MLELLRVRLIGSSIFRGSNYREFELSGIRVIGVRVIGDLSYLGFELSGIRVIGIYSFCMICQQLQ